MVKCYVDYNTRLVDSTHADVFTANALVYDRRCNQIDVKRYEMNQLNLIYGT